eukprot:snap_masked-scaffold_7-processed-gene-2.29-mRNA-1 protein AED:0.07 eAED:1.00 QI:0/-1/0/1/-1/1/1/0/320
MAETFAKDGVVVVILDKVNPTCYKLLEDIEKISEDLTSPLEVVYKDDTPELKGENTPQIWYGKTLFFSDADISQFSDSWKVRQVMYEQYPDLLNLKEKKSVEEFLKVEENESKVVVFSESFSPWSISLNSWMDEYKNSSETFKHQLVFCDKLGARGTDVQKAALVVAGQARLPIAYLITPLGKEVFSFDQFKQGREDNSLESKFLRNGIFGESIQTVLEATEKSISENDLFIGRTPFGMYCAAVQEYVEQIEGEFEEDMKGVNVKQIIFGDTSQEDKDTIRALRVLSGGKTFPFVFVKGEHLETKEFVGMKKTELLSKLK